MTEPFTLVQRSGKSAEACRLSESALLMVDCQKTYTTGVMKLSGVEAAMAEAAKVLNRAREAGAPIVHVMHDSGPGTPYDITSDIGQIHAAVTPRHGEAIVVKNFPSSFAQTDLHKRLQKLGRRKIIVTGFMTHMCINSTVRAAFTLGYRSTVVGGATATRDLPGRGGTVVDAAQLHEASLAALSDLFAVVVDKAKDLPA